MRSLLVLLATLAVAVAFAPSSSRPAFCASTALQFKFLKEMGLEKPDWLPDFGGGKKEEEAPKAEATEEEEEEEEVTAEATTEE